MKLELRIPISPTPAFYAQVRLIAQSLASLGGPYAAAKILVSVGDRPTLAEVQARNAWANSYPVYWYIVPDASYAGLSSPHWASGHGRYARPSDADVVVLCDADTCPVARFDELLERLHRAPPTVAGLQAHYTPFPQASSEENDATWRRVLCSAGLPDARMSRPYSMDVEAVQGVAPAYFNYGFVAFNATRELPTSVMAAQIALSLAILRSGIDVLDLGHEYNCANDDHLLRHALVCPEDLRVVHYLRGDDIARHEFLCDRTKFESFLGRERSNAINERLRRHLLTLPDACAAEVFA
jgi:hypothetical protein